MDTLFMPSVLTDENCLTIIGMAGAGKTTVGHLLAERLGWAHVDTDHLIEAIYGVRLQTIADAMSKEAFLAIESAVIKGIRMQRVVLSTGGSVVYSPQTMEYLVSLGPVVHFDVPLHIILERIARKPDRGLAIAPGQTVEDLFREREILYRQWATHSISLGELDIPQCADAVFSALGKTLAKENKVC